MHDHEHDLFMQIYFSSSSTRMGPSPTPHLWSLSNCIVNYQHRCDVVFYAAASNVASVVRFALFKCCLSSEEVCCFPLGLTLCFLDKMFYLHGIFIFL